MVRSSKARWPTACVVLAAMLLGGCGVIPAWTSANEPLCPDVNDYKCGTIGQRLDEEEVGNVMIPKFQAPRARMNLDFRVKGEHDSIERAQRLPPAFVGISLSGGGSRSANFSMAVLQELDRLGILQHVTAISSTSGGGLAGAYYALHGPDIDWAAAKAKMGYDYLGAWIAKNFNPINLLELSLTHKDRSDLMAEVFDNVLFHGATYADLGAFGKGRPLFFANATDTAMNSAFRFEEYSFMELNARLDTYPVSRAVMASAAFPGVFNSVTLTRYASNDLREPGHGLADGYMHLMDGGPTDNLGLDTLRSLAATYGEIKRADEGSRQAPCFLFVIDSYPTGNPFAATLEPDPRGIVGRLVDPNFSIAFDTLLKLRRDEALRQMRLRDPSLLLQASGTTGKLQDIDVAGGTFKFWDHLTRVSVIDLPLSRGSYRCTVWHINLSGIESIPFRWDKAVEREIGVERASTVLRSRAKTALLVEQVQTNFRLVGSAGCSQDLLQAALYEAAVVLVDGDEVNRKRICDEFQQGGLVVSASCSASASMDVRFDPDIRYVAPKERIANRAVQCVRDVGKGAR